MSAKVRDATLQYYHAGNSDVSLARLAPLADLGEETADTSP